MHWPPRMWPTHSLSLWQARQVLLSMPLRSSPQMGLVLKATQSTSLRHWEQMPAGLTPRQRSCRPLHSMPAPQRQVRPMQALLPAVAGSLSASQATPQPAHWVAGLVPAQA